MTSDVIRRSATLVALAAAAALLVALSLENRRLRAVATDLFERSAEPHAGLVVPILDARHVEGGRLTIGAPGEGERQLLFFFTTTCPYCLASVPAVKEIAATLAADSTVALYGVALDTLPATRDYVEAHGLGFPVATADARAAALYRVRRVPQLTVIGPDGRVVYTRQGVLEDRLALDSVLAAVRMPLSTRDATAVPPRDPKISGGP